MVTRCDTCEDCPQYEEGYYWCCLPGCHGMLLQGSNICGCIKDTETNEHLVGVRRNIDEGFRVLLLMPFPFSK